MHSSVCHSKESRTFFSFSVTEYQISCPKMDLALSQVALS